ncbi:alpha/beta hydrolase [Streptomyces sp. JJ38]|uniref:alpha/beta hydrolase n=1 Tax=Streptomyces sp. JJ38 TaxID=2738128 RepID=UPI001C57E407|nr:alpha/beta hydrolase [Streptomyces sp. JJ38]MBW1598319.1 alpha/beta fold hydrolase [Streptomyces sp. JJ38]
MNRAIRRRGLAVTAALSVLVPLSLSGCTSASPDRPDRPRSSAAPDPADRPELASFYRQKLDWTECGTYQCAQLTVPMDYAHPQDGRTFVLPVARAATADPDRRVGALVVNPGGPGASGVASLLEEGTAESLGASTREHFDVVSFDPRGVGASSPALTCEGKEGDSGGAVDEDDFPAGTQALYPRTAEEQAAAVSAAQAEAEACRKHSGDILPHVGTADVARDLDVLRAALGEKKLNYLGWSYGTSLGTSYAEQFPHRVRAMVLDGAVDPSLDWEERATSQSLGFRRAVEDYAERCADLVGDSCPAATPAGIRNLVNGLYERAAHSPLPVDGGDIGLDATGVLNVVTLAMYNPESQWEGLSEALSAAASGDGTMLAALQYEEAEEAEPGETEPGEAEAGEAEAGDGATASTDGDGDGAPVDPVPGDNEYAALTAVNCLDVPHPRDDRAYWDALEDAHDAAGLYGTSGVLTELTCKSWPSGTGRPHKVRAEGVPPVLVVGTTGDPATPYEEAVSLAEQFPGGMLLTYEGLGHTAYGRSGTCVTRNVDRYLVALRPVPAGTVC